MKRISQRAALHRVTESGWGDKDAENLLDRLLSKTEQAQRRRLISAAHGDGYDQTIEETAYT